MVIPQDIQAQIPYPSKYLDLDKQGSEKQTLHYFDEGEGDPIVCLHGNPTWSFYYRSVLKTFSQSNRVICMDHLGCGLSSRPQSYAYTLEQHIGNFSYFMDQLKLDKVTLVLHDWGGPIGLGWAVRNPEKVKRLVLLNTAGFLSKDIPTRIALCKTPWLGEYLIRTFNLFAKAAIHMAPAKPLASDVKRGLLYPYNNYQNRIALARFVKDIPLTPKHESYHELAYIEQNLKRLQCPKLILWGMKDFCFHEGFLNVWQKIFPDADIKSFQDAGHYILEDAPEQVNQDIKNFIQLH